MARTEVVLFDLGGVLIELGGVPVIRDWGGIESDDEVWARWLTCRWVRSFERGECTPDAFARGVVEDWNLQISPDVFLAEFREWPKRLLPGALDLLAALRGRVRRACFSNTNELHWGRFRDAWELGRSLDHHFVSHEIGLVKPDSAAFAHVLDRLECPAEAVLFLDDVAINVEGARRVGIDAEHAIGVEGARKILEKRGLLSREVVPSPRLVED